MRSVESTEEPRPDKRDIAEIAAAGASAGIDSYSEYGVGAAVVISFHDGDVGNAVTLEDMHEESHVETHIYGGSNINLSGMEVKIHAEQMALFQAILDIEETGMEPYAILEQVMVVTSEDDLALKCGHCLQVFAGACEHYSWDESRVGYHAAKGQTTYDGRGNPDGVHWDFRENTLKELIGETYVSK